MIVWIWDAPGSERAGSGVTDSEAAARLSAEEFMVKADAPAATIETAALDIGRSLTVGYTPTGHAWTATRAGDAITWTLSRQLAAS
jgi:hypothetical protein